MWLQVHLWAWTVASVWGAGVVGVARRSRGEWQDADTRAPEGRPDTCCGSNTPHDPQHTRPTRDLRGRAAANPIFNAVVEAESPQAGHQDLRASWYPQWRTSTDSRTSQDGRIYFRTYNSSPSTHQDSYKVAELERGQPVFPTAHRRLIADTHNSFQKDAKHHLRTATGGRGSTSRDLHTWADVRGTIAELQRAEETRNHARRSQVGSQRHPYTPNNGDINNRYRVGSEASVSRSRSHHLQPEASETTRSYSRVGDVEEQRSRGSQTRHYYRMESQTSPMISTQSQYQHDSPSYSRENSAASRSLPGDSLPLQSNSVNTRRGSYEDHRRREQQDVAQPGYSTWPAPSHTAPVQRSGVSLTSDDSPGAPDDPYGTHYLTKPSTPIEDGPQGAPVDSPVSQDLYISRHDALDDDRETRLDNSPDWCCGSKVPFDPDNAVSTGGLSRVASAGSVKVVAVPAPDTDLYPPVNVRDLRVVPLDPHTIDLTWTAPGDDLDFGTASRYVFRLSDTVHDLKESRFDLAPDDTLLDVADLLMTSDVYQTAGTEVSVRVPLAEQLQLGHLYYMALRAFDDHENASPVSNVARFSIPRPLSDAPGRPTTTVEDDLDDPDVEEHNKSPSGFPEERNLSQPTAQDDRERVAPPRGDTIPPGSDEDTQSGFMGPIELPLTISEPTESNLIVPVTTEPTVVVTEPTEPGLRIMGEENYYPTTRYDRGREEHTGTAEPGQRDLEETAGNDSHRRGWRGKNRRNKKEQKSRKNRRREGKKNRRRKNKGRREGRQEEEGPENQDASDTSVFATLLQDINAEIDSWRNP